ncbi:hypothetical protein [Chitinophaga sp. OAE865]|uniref:hypothetical protein n=1 Tax=Chitinophaga sp. OAE865 TaxID=2817898 RepID=UPI001AE776AF
MAAFRNISLPISYKLPLEQNPAGITILADGGYLLNFSAKPEVIRLNASLQEVWRKDLQAQTRNHVNCEITASPDNRLIALSNETAVRITDSEGQLLWQYDHAPWYHFMGSGCFFSADTKFMWFVSPEEQDTLHRLRLSDFTIIDSYPLETSQECAYNFYATPDKNKFLLETPAGQDAVTLYLIRFSDDAMTLEELTQCNDCIAGNFSPDGKTFITAPHYSEAIQLLSFPGMEKTGALPQEILFDINDRYKDAEEPDSVNYTALFINNDTFLVFTRFGRCLLADRHTLTCFGELLPEGCDTRAYDFSGNPTTDPTAIVDYGGDIITLQVNMQGQLLITHSSGELRVYDLPEIKKETV